METAEQDSDKSEEENEYSSEQSEDTRSDGSTSAEEAAEINFIEDIIATTNETKGFSKPKGKKKLDTDPNAFSEKRRNNAIELELRTKLPYNNFKKVSCTGILDSGNSCKISAFSLDFSKN